MCPRTTAAAGALLCSWHSSRSFLLQVLPSTVAPCSSRHGYSQHRRFTLAGARLRCSLVFQNRPITPHSTLHPPCPNRTMHDFSRASSQQQAVKCRAPSFHQGCTAVASPPKHVFATTPQAGTKRTNGAFDGRHAARKSWWCVWPRQGSRSTLSIKHHETACCKFCQQQAAFVVLYISLVPQPNSAQHALLSRSHCQDGAFDGNNNGDLRVHNTPPSFRPGIVPTNLQALLAIGGICHSQHLQNHGMHSTLLPHQPRHMLCEIAPIQTTSIVQLSGNPGYRTVRE